jgi:hypothetical protein
MHAQVVSEVSFTGRRERGGGEEKKWLFLQADLVPDERGVSRAEEALGGSLDGRAGGNNLLGRLGLGRDHELALRLLGSSHVLGVPRRQKQMGKAQGASQYPDRVREQE